MGGAQPTGGADVRAPSTAVEVGVVLVVVLMLSGIAVPLFGGYGHDDRRVRAESEVDALAATIRRFHNDVGTWPARNASGADNHLYLLMSGERQPAANPFVGGHSFVSWGLGVRGDTLDNHLVHNQPRGAAGAAYPVAGENRWRGPYLPTGAALDPWGRPYLVNVVSGWSDDGRDHRQIYVLSAGPDGRINTSHQGRAGDAIAGDDIGVILHRRP